MAVNVEDTKVRASIRLAKGLDTQGNVKAVTVSIGTLSVSGYDDEKAIAILEATREMFQYEVMNLERVKTATVEGQ